MYQRIPMHINICICYHLELLNSFPYVPICSNVPGGMSDWITSAHIFGQEGNLFSTQIKYSFKFNGVN